MDDLDDEEEEVVVIVIGRNGFVVVLVDGIAVGFVVDFGSPCLAFVVDIVVVEIVVIVEIVEVARESQGNRIGVGYQMRVSEGLTKKTSWGSSHRGGQKAFVRKSCLFF
ncbi:hypothetical protein Tco_0767976 [Tanacetum coccineum]